MFEQLKRSLIQFLLMIKYCFIMSWHYLGVAGSHLHRFLAHYCPGFEWVSKKTHHFFHSLIYFFRNPCVVIKEIILGKKLLIFFLASMAFALLTAFFIPIGYTLALLYHTHHLSKLVRFLIEYTLEISLLVATIPLTRFLYSIYRSEEAYKAFKTKHLYTALFMDKKSFKRFLYFFSVTALLIELSLLIIKSTSGFFATKVGLCLLGVGLHSAVLLLGLAVYLGVFLYKVIKIKSKINTEKSEAIKTQGLAQQTIYEHAVKNNLSIVELQQEPVITENKFYELLLARYSPMLVYYPGFEFSENYDPNENAITIKYTKAIIKSILPFFSHKKNCTVRDVTTEEILTSNAHRESQGLHFYDLPPELLYLILSYVSVRDLSSLSRVSRLLYHAANDASVWQYKNRFDAILYTPSLWEYFQNYETNVELAKPSRNQEFTALIQMLHYLVCAVGKGMDISNTHTKLVYLAVLKILFITHYNIKEHQSWFSRYCLGKIGIQRGIENLDNLLDENPFPNANQAPNEEDDELPPPVINILGTDAVDEAGGRDVPFRADEKNLVRNSTVKETKCKFFDLPTYLRTPLDFSEPEFVPEENGAGVGNFF